MSSKKIYKSGEKIGNFTYLRDVDDGINLDGSYFRRVEVICSYCNKVFETRHLNLTRTRKRLYSCGCQRKNQVKERLEKINQYHGHSTVKTPEYITWCGMKNRCYYEKNNRYKAYGGRGIIVCDRWRDSFQNFLEDMGVKPGPEYSIDRIDVNGNYEPSNCRWATSEIQYANTRPKEIRIKVNIGDVYGNLTIVSEAEPYVHNDKSHSRYYVKCNCGNEFLARKSHVTTGKVFCCYGCRPKKKRPGRPKKKNDGSK